MEARDRALPKTDFRAWLPRFAARNLGKNHALVKMLGALAREKGTTVAAAGDRYPPPLMAHLDSERRSS